MRLDRNGCNWAIADRLLSGLTDIDASTCRYEATVQSKGKIEYNCRCCQQDIAEHHSCGISAASAFPNHVDRDCQRQDGEQRVET